MSTSTVEDRTRMYHPRQDIYLRRGPGDRSFERQLPAEIRAELEASPAQINHQPAWIPTSEQEIQAAIRWLKSQGYLQSGSASSEKPPLVPPAPVMPGTGKPAQSASRSGIWLLLAALVGFPILIGMLSQALSTLSSPTSRPLNGAQPQARPVEVRRALPPPVEVRKRCRLFRELSSSAFQKTRPHLLLMGSGVRQPCWTAGGPSRPATRVNCQAAPLSPIKGALLARSGQLAIRRGSG